jgi:hypothetical protein
MLAALLVALLEGLSALVWFSLPDDFTPKQSVKHLVSAGWSQPSHKPHAFWHHSLNPAHKDYMGLLNRYGMKGDDFQMPKPQDEYRIVCLGDSTTESTGVGPSETYPVALQEKLREDNFYPGLTVKVINAGIGSHNSAFNLAYLAYFLIHLQPDLVIIKSTYNDYLPFVASGMGYDYSHAFPEPYSLDGSRQLHWLAARFSFFLRLLGVVVMAAIDRPAFSNFSGDVTFEQLQDLDYAANENKFFVYKENIRSMIALCKIRGIDCIVVDLPTSPDPNHFGEGAVFGENYRRLIGRLEKELKSVCDEEQVTFVNTQPLLGEDFWDHCHNTPSGNTKIATRIAESMREDLSPTTTTTKGQ